MDFSWGLLTDLGIISIALLVATALRARVGFFQRFLIPNALTAGFLLLPFYNFLAPLLELSTEGLGELVYHLLSVSFVAITLRRTELKGANSGYEVPQTSVAVLFQYGLQGFIGLLLTALLIGTIFPDLFPSFGLFVPLGFALGPGQAFAIGRGWETFGFAGAGTVGLTFAAIGFLIASFGGVFLVNYGYRRGWLEASHGARAERRSARRGVVARDEEAPVGSRLTTVSEAVESMSINLGLVLAVYLVSYLLLRLITYLLGLAGELGTDLAVNLWGINFVFATITALGVKRALRMLKVEHVLDGATLTRISGMSVDVMVAAAVGAISLVVVGQYWLPIVIVAVGVGTLVMITVPWTASRLFRSHRFERTLIVFGGMTGTLPTGLALLRILDPDFDTPVARDYIFASAVIFVLAIPMILAINLPAYSVTRDNPLLFWLTVAIVGAYVLGSALAYARIARRRAFAQPGRLWFSDSSR
mgnify:CR=1 FL=1